MLGIAATVALFGAFPWTSGAAVSPRDMATGQSFDSGPSATANAILSRSPSPPEDAQQAIERCPGLNHDTATADVLAEVEAALRKNSKDDLPDNADLQRMMQGDLARWKEMAQNPQSKKNQQDLQALGRAAQEYSRQMPGDPKLINELPRLEDAWTANWKRLQKRLDELSVQYDEHDPCRTDSSRGCAERVMKEWNDKKVQAVDAYLGEARTIWNKMAATMNQLIIGSGRERAFAYYDMVKRLVRKADACPASEIVDFLVKKSGDNNSRR